MCLVYAEFKMLTDIQENILSWWLNTKEWFVSENLSDDEYLGIFTLQIFKKILAWTRRPREWEEKSDKLQRLCFSSFSPV